MKTSLALMLATTLGLAGSSTRAESAEECGAVPETMDANAADVRRFAHAQGKQILTFVGYSAAGYEDPANMLVAADRELDAHQPSQTLVNIGATAEGIGAVYALAKARGFVTIGIVSSLARDERQALAPCVDHVFFIQDESWGGRLAGSDHLAPTSAAIVALSQRIVGIGGGEIARDEMLAARQAGIPVDFIPADMNHALAREKAAKKGEPEPVDFRGAAYPALMGGS